MPRVQDGLQRVVRSRSIVSPSRTGGCPVSVPGTLRRVLGVLLLPVAGVLAVLGGLALRAPGVVAVGVAGFLAGLTAGAIAHDTPGSSWRSTLESAALTVAGSVGLLLIVSGTSVLVGGAGTALLLAALALAWLAYSWRRSARQHKTAAAAGLDRPVDAVHLFVVQDDEQARDEQGPARIFPPVTALSTAALGREWLRTSAALAGRIDPVMRRSIVARRVETLDELERRDPDGFGRWIARGPEPASDPAEYVRRGPVTDTEAA